MKSSTENVKRLKGDGLRVNMDLNDLNLKVSGDGCRVTVERNCGKIRVIGDGCSLKVNCNDGDIEYKGDGGSIFLGGGSRTESVSYVGDGGRISVRSSNKVGSSGSVDDNRRVKRSGRKNNGKEVDKSGYSVSDSELEMKLDNEANESKEAGEKRTAKAGLDDTKDRANLRRSKTIVITEISAKHVPVNINNKNSSLVKNWFRNPPRVTRTFKSGPESL